MASSGLIGVLFWLPVLVALWVGVAGLAKAGRGGAWWAMVSGMSLVSLGLVISVVGGILLVRSFAVARSGGGSPQMVEWMQYVAIGGALAVGLGMLLFGVGFALHGFQARRMKQRIEELEMVVAAQNDQLSRDVGGPQR